MPAKKKASKKKSAKSSKSSAPKMCLRHIDQNTLSLSDDERFREYNPERAENLPKGTTRVDANNVISF